MLIFLGGVVFLLVFGVLLITVLAQSAERKEWEAYATDVRSALALSGISLKEAAFHMGIDMGQLSRELSGTGHLSARRLALLPKEFQQWFSLVRYERLGAPSIVNAAERLKQSSVSSSDRGKA